MTIARGLITPREGVFGRHDAASVSQRSTPNGCASLIRRVQGRTEELHGGFRVLRRAITRSMVANAPSPTAEGGLQVAHTARGGIATRPSLSAEGQEARAASSFLSDPVSPARAATLSHIMA